MKAPGLCCYAVGWMKGNIKRKQIGIAMMEIRYMEVENYGKSKRLVWGIGGESEARERQTGRERDTDTKRDRERKGERVREIGRERMRGI